MTRARAFSFLFFAVAVAGAAHADDKAKADAKADAKAADHHGVEHRGDPRPRATTDFYATIQSSSRKDGECLLFSGNGQDPQLTRYLWGDNKDLYACGLPDDAALVKNKQAVFHFVAVADDAYIVLNASKNGETEECLIFGGNGKEKYPQRYLWEPNKSQFCGFKTRKDLVENKQAIFRLVRLEGNKYAMRNASSGKDECLIFGGNGKEDSPSRYLWGDGPAEFCGMKSKADLLTNKQAVFTINVLP